MNKLAIVVVAAIIGISVTTSSYAQSTGIVIKQSAFSVKATMDRLEAILKKKGITVFARIDHAAGAARVKKELAPAEIIIFGNPKIGTPLMQSNIVAGLDLPLKALVYSDGAGKVFLAYNHPGYLSRRHAIKDRKKLIKSVSRILINLTDQAIKQKQQ